MEYNICTSKFIKNEKESEINRVFLTINKKSTLEGIELLPNSSYKIKYELYPFEQCEELSLDVLFPNEKFEEINYNDSNIKYLIPWTNELTLVIKNDVSYKVLLNGKFFSGFTDDICFFQIGDGYTKAYKNKNNDLIIYNFGDVSSVVVIKYKH
jgi:hypothetical protein